MLLHQLLPREGLGAFFAKRLVISAALGLYVLHRLSRIIEGEGLML